MMVVRRLFPLLGLLLLPACGSGKDRPEPDRPVPANWRAMITKADMDRLRDWRTAFVQAVEKARAAGHGDSIAREGRLLDADAALDGPSAPAGRYRCRVIKIGGKGAMMGDYVVYPPAPCSLSDEQEVMGFAKSGGTQRPVGLIFPADGNRMIFLGTMVLGDEQRPLDYGRDSMRDMVGAFERVGEKRWRLILPSPRFESMLDVIELTPEGQP